MIYLTGDINLTDNAFDIGFGVGSRIKSGYNPFQFIDKKENDLWVGNFEGVLSDETNCVDYHRNVFRINTDAYKKILDPIDIYGLANNHVMEHGDVAYSQMDEILQKADKKVFGLNTNRSVTALSNGKKISIIGFSLREDGTGYPPCYWNYPEMKELEDEVRKQKEVDFRIAYIHWGVEYIDYPSVEQIQFAHWLVDIGFDLIVGMHPHVLQGFEVYKGKHIFYSLGNFVFNMTFTPSLYGAVVKLNTDNFSVSYDYVRIDNEYCPHIVSEGEVPQAYRFSVLNQKIGKLMNLENYVAEANKGLSVYQKHNRIEIIKNFHKFEKRIFISMIKDYIIRRF